MIYNEAIKVYTQLSMSKFDSYNEDTAVDQLFHQRQNSQDKRHIIDDFVENRNGAQKSYLFEDRKQKLNQAYRINNVKVLPQRQYKNEPRHKNVVQQSTKSKYTCGLEKCRICKKIKPQTDRKHMQFLVRKKNKAPLPPLPYLKSKKKLPQSGVQVMFQSDDADRNRTRRRKVHSMVEDHLLYDNLHQSSVHKLINSRVSQTKRKYDTQPDQPGPRYIRLRGKMYEVVQDEHDERGKIQYETGGKIGKIRSLINPIMDAENWKSHKIQQEKQKQELNQLVNKYINFETIFQQMNSGNIIKINHSPTRTGNVPKKMTLYRLKSENSDQKDNMFQTFYQRQQTLNIEETQQQVNQSEIYNIKFPSISEVEESISAYQSLTGQFKIEVMRNSPNYIREYSDQPGHEFLYFGSYDHVKKQRKGLGVYVSKKIILEGIWMKDQILKGAELKTNSLYQGDFKNNKKSGEGVCKWLNGEQYMGQWQNGQRHGHGFWSAQRGSQTYSGEWKKGKVYGYGQYFKKNYSQFKGHFQNFIKNGTGIQAFFNNDKFEGVYANGLPDGKGIYTWDCGLRYQGQFKKGQRNGKGCLKMEGIFEIAGDFEKDRPHGICQLKMKNDDIFVGKFVYGSRYGYGKLQNEVNRYVEQGFWRNEVLKQKLEDDEEQKREIFDF